MAVAADFHRAFPVDGERYADPGFYLIYFRLYYIPCFGKSKIKRLFINFLGEFNVSRRVGTIEIGAYFCGVFFS